MRRGLPPLLLLVLLLFLPVLAQPAAGFTLTIGYALIDQFTVRLQAETDCPDCTYRWILGDGAVLEGQEVFHTYAPEGLWGYYFVELLVCTPGQAVCEARAQSVLIVNWTVLLFLGGGLLALALILGRSRIRARILKRVRR